MKKLVNLLNKRLVYKDPNGIWITNLNLSRETKISQSAWEKIYNQDIKQLKMQKKEFNKTKLSDHMKYIEKSYNFSSKTIYLEIGCGPAYIGEFLMKKYNCYFIGVDFNYGMLTTLKKYFDGLGYKKYLLIHSDISKMPIKKCSVHYIYGGGVIEHLNNTNKILKELHRVLINNGVSFNTIPAFNLWWILRFWNNIPNLPILKQLLELIHVTILKGKVLNQYFGYELSYTLSDLKKIHTQEGFTCLNFGPFVFHPSKKKLKNPLLQKLYLLLSSNKIFSPVYYIYGKK